jgi:hypothetical protein
VPLFSLGRGPRYGFEFCRHDTLSIYAAFELCRLLRSGFTLQKSTAGVIARGALTPALDIAHN